MDRAGDAIMQLVGTRDNWTDLYGRKVIEAVDEGIPKKPMGVESRILEPHYTCKQLAEFWGWSESKVYKMFVNEPGVLRSGERSKRKRTKISIRIPLSVAERMYKKLTA